MPDPATPSQLKPVDAEVDLRVPAQRWELAGTPLGVLAVISAGGVLGALARHGLGVAFPHGVAVFPWATFGINVTGCALIGVLMVGIDQLGAHRLLRPFLGVGVLGGFTTFSTQIVEAQHALSGGAAGLALAYLGGTLAAALVAVWAGSALTAALLRVLAYAGRRAGKKR